MNDVLIWTLSGVGVTRNPDALKEIDIEDIAHSLSNLCRFNGHVKQFYSVAEHCINVSLFLETVTEQLQGLLHDAAEYIINDIPTPIKHLSKEICDVEKGVLDKIARRYRIDLSCNSLVKRADSLMLYLEAKELTCIPHSQLLKFLTDRIPGGMTAEIADLLVSAESKGIKIRCLPPRDAYTFFMRRFDYLEQKRNEKT